MMTDTAFVEAVRLCGNGCVAPGANMFPQLFGDCYEAVINGDEQRAQALHRQINDLQRLYAIGRYSLESSNA